MMTQLLLPVLPVSPSMLDTCYAAVVELATMATNFGGVSGGGLNVSEVQSLRQRKLFSNQLFADANFEVF